MGDDLYESWAGHWSFATPLYLNHGSFGATPDEINILKERFDRELNADRDWFFWFEGPERLEVVRRQMAAFVGVDEGNMVLVDNVTEALASVLKSLSFEPGDEILITDHGYPPYEDVFRELARRTGVKFLVAEVPYPVTDDGQIIQAVLDRVTDRTRLAIIDHITSRTALVFPIARIVDALGKKGVDTFVDGAHAVGHVKLDLEKMGAAYYASNNHKWLCAPVSSGFLYVRSDRQADIIPAVASKDSAADRPFAARFSWQGTKNLSARLCLPETMAVIGSYHHEGWAGIYGRNHALAVRARELLSRELGLAIPCPESLTGAMFTLPFQKAPQTGERGLRPELRFNHMMREKFGYGLNTLLFKGRLLMRLTAHLYNGLADYERLVKDLKTIL